MRHFNNTGKIRKGDVPINAESIEKLNNEVLQSYQIIAVWNVNQTNVRDSLPNCWYVVDGFTQEAARARSHLSSYIYLGQLEKFDIHCYLFYEKQLFSNQARLLIHVKVFSWVFNVIL